MENRTGNAVYDNSHHEGLFLRHSEARTRSGRRRCSRCHPRLPAPVSRYRRSRSRCCQVAQRPSSVGGYTTTNTSSVKRFRATCQSCATLFRSSRTLCFGQKMVLVVGSYFTSNKTNRQTDKQTNKQRRNTSRLYGLKSSSVCLCYLCLRPYVLTLHFNPHRESLSPELSRTPRQVLTHIFMAFVYCIQHT